MPEDGAVEVAESPGRVYLRVIFQVEVDPFPLQIADPVEQLSGILSVKSSQSRQRWYRLVQPFVLIAHVLKNLRAIRVLKPIDVVFPHADDVDAPILARIIACLDSCYPFGLRSISLVTRVDTLLNVVRQSLDL